MPLTEEPMLGVFGVDLYRTVIDNLSSFSALIGYTAKFGMAGGICVPIHAPRGHVGCINFIATAEHNLEPILSRWRSALSVAGVHFMRAHTQPALDGLHQFL